MRFKSWPFGALPALAIVVGGIAISPAPTRADSNITFNFNEPNGKQLGWYPDPDPMVTGSITPYWDWNLGSSGTGGGWQAYSGTNAPLSAAALVSPCLVLGNNVNSDWVSVEISHRFNFPTVPILPSGSSANLLGQVQYRVASGGTTAWGDWLGIPKAYFTDEQGQQVSGNEKPLYSPPLFGPLIESGTVIVSGTPVVETVNAWAGTTLNFPSGNEVKSVFTLPYEAFSLALDDEIQFQFVVATDQIVGGTTALVWEINSVQIKGAKLCVVPEPAALALAGIGGLGCLLLVRRRRRLQAAKAVAGSTAATIVVVVTVVWAIAAAPARAQTSWNFELANGGWVQTGSSSSFPFVPAQNRWMWTGTVTPNPLTGGSSPHWHILAQGVQPPTSSGFFLTSPVFSGLSGTTPAQNARISIAHDFFFATGTSGRPVTTGQLQYRLNGAGPWFGLPLDAFTDGGSVLVDDPVFGPSPFKTGSTTFQLVDQSDYVAPTYLTPTGTAALPFVSADAASFLGATPLWPGDYYVPSQAFLNADTGLPAVGITSLQLRFTNLNLGANCVNDDGWNVRFVQVDFDTSIPPVPEPATFALGATGLAVLVAASAMRRRRPHQRPSRPSESP